MFALGTTSERPQNFPCFSLPPFFGAYVCLTLCFLHRMTAESVNQHCVVICQQTALDHILNSLLACHCVYNSTASRNQWQIPRIWPVGHCRSLDRGRRLIWQCALKWVSEECVDMEGHGMSKRPHCHSLQRHPKNTLTAGKYSCLYISSTRLNDQQRSHLSFMFLAY